MTTTWIILGATSTIARAFARRAAERGDGVILAGRDTDDLSINAKDCELRGASVAESIVFDALTERENYRRKYLSREM